MQNVLTLGEALQIMDSGQPFDIEWITADRRRNRGGEILFVKGARLWGGTYKRKDREAKGKAESKKKRSGSPNHYANGTRNLYLSNMKKRKVHIQLITKINGLPVV